MDPVDPNRVLEHCGWLTLALLEQIRLQWGLHAYVRDDGGVYVTFHGNWCVTAAPSFGSGIEHGIEALLRIRLEQRRRLQPEAPMI